MAFRLVPTKTKQSQRSPRVIFQLLGLFLLFALLTLSEYRGIKEGGFSLSKQFMYTTSDIVAVVSSIVPKNTSTTVTRPIEAKLVRNLPLLGLYANGQEVYYKCFVGEPFMSGNFWRWGGAKGHRLPLRGNLNRTGLLDSHVVLSKFNLRVMMVGNSLSEQLHAGMQEAMCISPLLVRSSWWKNNNGFYTPWKNTNNGKSYKPRPYRKTVQNGLKRNNRTTSYPHVVTNNHNNINPNTTTNGDPQQSPEYETICETTVYDRNHDDSLLKPPITIGTDTGSLTHVMSRVLVDEIAGIWNRNNPVMMDLRNDLKQKQAAAADKRSSISNSLLDVIVFQFPSGHARLDLREYYFQGLVEVASDLFGATTLILPTIAWTNNIMTDEDITHLQNTNALIRNFARKYNKNNSHNNSTVQRVQVLDYAKFMDEYIVLNGHELGIPPNETYRMRLAAGRWKHLVAHLCAELPDNSTAYHGFGLGCTPGIVSLDGMHTCPQTIHGHINAALVCLLDCAYNRDNNEKGESINACSDHCNSKYMSLMHPIEFPPDGVLDLTPPIVI